MGMVTIEEICTTSRIYSSPFSCKVTTSFHLLQIIHVLFDLPNN